MERMPNKSKRRNAKRKLDTFLSNRLAVAGGIVVILFVLAVVFAPLLTNYNPATPDLRNRTAAPGKAHLFGTDKLGHGSWL